MEEQGYRIISSAEFPAEKFLLYNNTITQSDSNYRDAKFKAANENCYYDETNKWWKDKEAENKKIIFQMINDSTQHIFTQQNAQDDFDKGCKWIC